MLSYYQAKKIQIDGSALAGSWICRVLGGSSQGRMDASNYESEVLRLLDQIIGRKAGSAVIKAVQDVGVRRGLEVRIVPYKGDEGGGPHNAGTRADSLKDSTPHALIPGYSAGTHGNGVRGTGLGSSSEIHFSPKTSAAPWLPTCPAAAPATDGCSITPMAPQQVDDCLLHEIVHAVRQMDGLFNPLQLEQASYKGDEEEFYAVLVQNIYISETGRRLLRRDHGYSVMSDALNDSQWFLGKGMGPVTPDDDDTELHGFQAMNRRLVTKFVTLHPTFAVALASSPARFNPIREFLANRTDYPPL